MKEKQEELDKFVLAAGLADSVGTDAFEEKAKEFIEKGIRKELADKRKHRLVEVLVPDAFKPLGLEDKEGNMVFRMVALKSQADDAIKACRRKGVSARIFSYDREQWTSDNSQRQLLKESLENKTTSIKDLAQIGFQELFVALMHLKVIRAYIDGVLRFGIPPRFYIGVVFPGKGQERTVLQELNNALADENLKEMYGEKLDVQEADDYWAFVCINLTSPAFLHHSA